VAGTYITTGLLTLRIDCGAGLIVVDMGVSLRGGYVGAAKQPLGDPDILRGSLNRMRNFHSIGKGLL
jgi:hypothetical protein